MHFASFQSSVFNSKGVSYVEMKTFNPAFELEGPSTNSAQTFTSLQHIHCTFKSERNCSSYTKINYQNEKPITGPSQHNNRNKKNPADERCQGSPPAGILKFKSWDKFSMD
ncbi:hypothetical protein AVEN_192310-1 [Araneus ventricosus]|uniref:Uncharacterized protein n=1 Tax=Araneus ventricosus TaxID=182803 RepID=A0A4Y2JLC4_ARAVE|nr:hypothetical protein AVEN_192310-1 [Araneus ventricosus]